MIEGYSDEHININTGRRTQSQMAIEHTHSRDGLIDEWDKGYYWPFEGKIYPVNVAVHI